MLKITSYAEKLIQDLDDVQFLDKIKTQQVNWIGRSEGSEVTFSVDGVTDNILVFTTRPDTLFGATFMIR
jgi:leucyl-tRNA synthetase